MLLVSYRFIYPLTFGEYKGKRDEFRNSIKKAIHQKLSSCNDESKNVPGLQNNKII